jgi:hypothetical protein
VDKIEFFSSKNNHINSLKMAIAIGDFWLMVEVENNPNTHMEVVFTTPHPFIPHHLFVLQWRVLMPRFIPHVLQTYLSLFIVQEH